MLNPWPEIQNQNARWKPSEIAVLHVLDEVEAAKLLGRSVDAVIAKKAELNIVRIRVKTVADNEPREIKTHASQRQAIVMIEHAAMQALKAADHPMVPSVYREIAERFAADLMEARAE